jgi:translation initiation factor 5A
VVVGTDIFTEKNYEDMAPSSHNIYVPIVVKNELALLDINSDGYLTMMNDEGEQKEDLKVEDPEVTNIINNHYNFQINSSITSFISFWAT